jgi:formate dehydrogenase subunit delta
MNIDTLVRMANDIGAFFAAEPDQDEAVRAVLGHLKRFWDPRMRTQIVEHYRSGAAGLSELSRAAVALLAADQVTTKNT